MKKIVLLCIFVLVLISCASVPKANIESYFKYDKNQFEFTNISGKDRENDFWYIDPSSEEKKYKEIKFQICKEKGQDNFGFGIIYNYKDDNNYTRLLLDVNQNLSVMTKIDGIEYMNLGWTYMPSLKAGLNEINQIQIIQENEYKINIFINDQMSVFISNGSPLFGSIGAYIAVGDQDKRAGDVKVKILINNIKEQELYNII